jgi:alpha-D-xyloside xylohydrolase
MVNVPCGLRDQDPNVVSGMWLTAPDKHVEYAECVYSITEKSDGKGLELLCPTRKIYSRGDTLNCPTLTIHIYAEFHNVLSVEVVHWSGQREQGPKFDLYPDGKPEGAAEIRQGEYGVSLTSGNLKASVKQDSKAFSIQFDSNDGGLPVTQLLNRSVGFAYEPVPGNMMEVENLSRYKHHIFTQSELSVGESIHGLGERFGPFNKIGQNVQIWNADGYTTSSLSIHLTVVAARLQIKLTRTFRSG